MFEIAGWEGDTCNVDIDECAIYSGLCQHDSICQNLFGSFYCECEDNYCGQTCMLENPCITQVCFHNNDYSFKEREFLYQKIN